LQNSQPVISESYAFDKIGVPSEALFSLLLLSWVGSWVHIPLARLPAEGAMMEGGVVRVFGQRYVVPQWCQPRHTVLAVNVGGAVVPTCLSLYLLMQAQAPLRVVVATAAVTFLTYRWARPWPPSSWCRSKPHWPRMWLGLWAHSSVATSSMCAR
jgi:uncharacterized membrane protein